MEKNVCGFDRLVRLTVGPVLILAYLRSRSRKGDPHDATVSRWHIATAYVGVELAVTGFLQWCPGNYLLGVDTCDREWRLPDRSPFRRGNHASHSSGLVS